MEILKHNDTGYLSLIIGPMFSGKTTRLIEMYERLSFCSKNKKSRVCVINYIEDNRYGSSSMLVSHKKRMINCISLDKLESLIKDSKYIKEYDTFLINEGQFFEDLQEVVLELVNNYKKNIYIAALDGDYLRRPFDNVMSLIPQCDDIVKLKSLCKNCRDGTEALFSYRITNEQEVKVIGTGNYVPLCRKCYNKVFNNI